MNLIKLQGKSCLTMWITLVVGVDLSVYPVYGEHIGSPLQRI